MDDNLYYELDELINEGKFNDAISLIDELEPDELNNSLILTKAHCLSQLGRYREAYKILQTNSSEFTENDLAYLIELAGALFGLHRYNSAIKAAKRCLSQDSNCIEAWLVLCLVYQETGDTEKFEQASDNAKDLDFDSWNDIFGDKTDCLQRYSDEEKNAVIDYIEKVFGNIDSFIYKNDDPDNPISIAVVSMPGNDLYRILITVGLGAYKGFDTSDDETLLYRTELVSYIPCDIHFREYEHLCKWVSNVMFQFAEMVELDGSFLDVGHTISYGGSLDETVEYDGVLFLPNFETANNNLRCTLPEGYVISFLQMIPLYEEELIYKIEEGFPKLTERLVNALKDNTDLIYPRRINTCLKPGMKKWAIPRSSLEEILQWPGSDGCFATDRITVDKAPVGIMYREKPHNESDSGWRFLAGDEDSAYMEDQNNMEILRLNTIANYDPAVIEYLEYPAGSYLIRKNKNEFELRFPEC